MGEYGFNYGRATLTTQIRSSQPYLTPSLSPRPVIFNVRKEAAISDTFELGSLSGPVYDSCLGSLVDLFTSTGKLFNWHD